MARKSLRDKGSAINTVNLKSSWPYCECFSWQRPHENTFQKAIGDAGDRIYGTK